MRSAGLAMPYTFVAHFCNDSAGYQPTREAFERGGYETRTANWSKLAPEALEMVQEHTVDLLISSSERKKWQKAPKRP